jgi:hypothetical protein
MIAMTMETMSTLVIRIGPMMSIFCGVEPGSCSVPPPMKYWKM